MTDSGSKRAQRLRRFLSRGLLPPALLHVRFGTPLVRTIPPQAQAPRASTIICRVAALCVILALVVIVFRHVLFDNYTWGNKGMDLTFGALPQFLAISKQSATWRMLQDFLGGTPLYNNGNYSPYYPLYLVWIFAGQSSLEALHTLDLITVLHYFVAGAASYIGLRILGVAPIAAMMGAVSLSLSANAIEMGGWLNAGAGYAWLPLCLMGIFRDSKRRRAPEQARRDHSTRCACHTCLPRTARSSPLDRRANVCGGRIKPSVESIELSIRPCVHSARDGGNHPFRYRRGAARAASFSRPTLHSLVQREWNLSSAVLCPPTAFSNSASRREICIALLIPTTYYIGIVFIGLPLFLLCASALRFSTRQRIKIGLLIIIAVWTIVLCGDQTPAGKLIQHIPFFNQVRMPPRHMPILLVAVVVLAAFGLDDLVRLARGERLAALRALVDSGWCGARGFA